MAEAANERAGEDLLAEDEVTSRERIVRGVVLAVLLIVATILAYQKIWHAGFIWDDDIYVTTNSLLTAPDGLKKIWLSLESPSQYFPLAYTTFRFEHVLWGLNPIGYHWVNLALHIANALLLWRLLSILRIPGAWLAAALFALHPVQVESVGWISERKNVLMAFFYLLALLAWVKFVAGKHKGELKFYALALLCFLLALFSKTTACTLPVALLLISWLKRGSISLQRVLQVLPFLILGAAMAGVSIWWERFHQGTQGELFSLGAVERLLVAARNFWFYLEKLAWPAQLAFSYPRWSLPIANPMSYVWLGACLLLVIVILILRRWLGRGPETAFIFFAAMLAPTLGFVMLYTFRYSFVADHYQYLASIGPLTLVAAAIATATNSLPRAARQSAFVLLAAAMLVPLGLRTWRHGAAYVNEESLWRATLAVNPESWMAHNNLAILLVNRGEADEAMSEYKEALRLDPNYAEAYYNLGTALMRKGRLSEARPNFERALELNPRMAVAHTNLGILLLQEGRPTDALTQFNDALKIDPRASVARERLGELLVSQGRIDEGIAQFQATLEVDPNSKEAHEQLALALLRQDRPEEALVHAEQTLDAKADDTAAQTNYGIMLAELGRDDEAVAHFEKALQLNPENAQAHYNLGNTFVHQRRVDEAMEQYRKAVELKPEYAAAHMNLANTLAESGRLEEAVAEYEKTIALRPDYARAHANLATALNRLGRYDEAMDHLRKSWELEAPSPSPTP